MSSKAAVESKVTEISKVEEIILEPTSIDIDNVVYDSEEEPELHARTWFALAALAILNLVQVMALQGPPSVVSDHR